MPRGGSFLIFSFNIAFAEQVYIHGEWKQDCIYAGYDNQTQKEVYRTAKLAFFNENEAVLSVQLYADSHCKEETSGNYYEIWQLTLEPSPTEKDLYQVNATFIGGESQCQKYITTALIPATSEPDSKYFYLGDKYDGTDNALGCEEKPTTLQTLPFTLFGRITQTREEYVSTLHQ